MTRPVIILGAGGHAKVLISALRLQSVPMLGATDADGGKRGQLLLDVPVLGDDEEIMKHGAETIFLVNGVGAVRVDPLRSLLFERFSGRGYKFVNVIHPSAVVCADATIAEGAQVMAGVVIQPGCNIGKNAVINTGATVDHDCYIGDHVHIAPGVTLSGGVRVGEGSHVGVGATVIQGVTIGRTCTVAAGAVVVRNVPDGATVAGVPAKEIGATS